MQRAFIFKRTLSELKILVLLQHDLMMTQNWIILKIEQIPTHMFVAFISKQASKQSFELIKWKIVSSAISLWFAVHNKEYINYAKTPINIFITEF